MTLTRPESESVGRACSRVACQRIMARHRGKMPQQPLRFFPRRESLGWARVLCFQLLVSHVGLVEPHLRRRQMSLLNVPRQFAPTRTHLGRIHYTRYPAGANGTGAAAMRFAPPAAPRYFFVTDIVTLCHNWVGGGGGGGGGGAPPQSAVAVKNLPAVFVQVRLISSPLESNTFNALR